MISRLIPLFVVVLVVVTVPAADSEAQITSGSNLGATPVGPISIPFDPDEQHYVFEEDLIFDPDAPPMIKEFVSPHFTSGAPIMLDGSQPLPFPIWEEFFIVPGLSVPVSDWHEEILTPGWEWRPLPDKSLITRDGLPWPSSPIPMPGGSDPTKIWVEFPPIEPGRGLDIHKAMVWVGAIGNDIWGDGHDNIGQPVDESVIRVLEYPTPEPSSFVLWALGLVVLGSRTRRMGRTC